jgi:hypothetical protein
VDCYDFPDGEKTYNFDDNVSPFAFGKAEGGAMVIDNSYTEFATSFGMPSDAENVVVSFDLSLESVPSEQAVFARLGDFYLELASLHTMAEGEESMFYGPMETKIVLEDGVYAVTILVDETIYTGGFAFGLRTEAASANAKVMMDNFALNMGFANGCASYGVAKNGGGGGDPHFQRWDHHHESFHGECDLVMVSSKNFHKGAGLDLHVRTKIEDYFSYIETAALRVGNSVLQFHKDFFYVDGAKYTAADLPFTFGGKFKYTIDVAELAAGKNPKFYMNYKVDLHEKSTIIFKFYKKYLTINVNGADVDFMDSVGLLGDYSTGDMVSRDGEIMHNFEEYGFEWQVTPEDPKLFLESRAPQLPFEQCRMPTASRPARRKLRGADDALFTAAKEACAHVHGSDFDLCADDVMTTGDVGLASMW